MDFVPHDNKAISEMLRVIGVSNIEELYCDIPRDLIIEKLNVPPGLSEPDLLRHMERISKKNRVYSSSFLGAGSYFHYIPSLVSFVISRSEFYTSYTPYQAEASQGYLQAIYEYQTIISRLTQMDVANASMYWGRNINTEITKENILLDQLHEDVAAVLFQSPNFYGDIEDVSKLVKKIKEKLPGCLVIQVMTDPTCLGILKPPGALDIDIFVSEGQSFGINPSFGGPGLGIFTAKQKYLRKIPGRLIGKTKEIEGSQEGFILTLQAREQHIRRDKASSNICTNQALCSLAALTYLLAMGKTGLREIATQNLQKAHFLKKEITKIPGYKILNKKPTYNEFLVECPNINSFISECKKLDLLPPLRMSKYYPEMQNVALVCVTEVNSRESINLLTQAAKIASDNSVEGDLNKI